MALVALLYFAAAKIGLSLAFVNPSATAVWPPTGIALAALLLLGYRIWPGILLGAFLANVSTSGSIPTSFAIAIGNTLEGLAGAYLVNRFANGRLEVSKIFEWFREDFSTLIQLLRAGKIHPVVAARLPLTEARRAHELLESAASQGKLVLVP